MGRGGREGGREEKDFVLKGLAGCGLVFNLRYFLSTRACGGKHTCAARRRQLRSQPHRIGIISVKRAGTRGVGFACRSKKQTKFRRLVDDRIRCPFLMMNDVIVCAVCRLQFEDCILQLLGPRYLLFTSVNQCRPRSHGCRETRGQWL